MQQLPSTSTSTSAEAANWSAVAEWYHAYFTGLVMSMVTRKSSREAAELVFHIFRKQHTEKFMAGLSKLGLDGLPPAVTAARYHYLSNAIGGVHVEYFEESPKKVWVRYPPPRWAWQGTAICAIPGEVSRAVLEGWHAHNGVSLGCKKLGFVCTKQTMDGQPGLEGYYIEYEHDIEPEQRLAFARGVEMPESDPALAPTLPTADWPFERREKARRNYAMEYMRTGLQQLVEVFGPVEAEYLGGVTGRLISMQFYASTAKALRCADCGDASQFADFLVALAKAQGDSAERVADVDGRPCVQQKSWKLMEGIPSLHPAVFNAWNELLVGSLSAHNRFLDLVVTKRLDQGDGCFEWQIVPRNRAKSAQ